MERDQTDPCPEPHIVSRRWPQCGPQSPGGGSACGLVARIVYGPMGRGMTDLDDGVFSAPVANSPSLARACTRAWVSSCARRGRTWRVVARDRWSMMRSISARRRLNAQYNGLRLCIQSRARRIFGPAMVLVEVTAGGRLCGGIFWANWHCERSEHSHFFE